MVIGYEYALIAALPILLTALITLYLRGKSLTYLFFFSLFFLYLLVVATGVLFPIPLVGAQNPGNFTPRAFLDRTNLVPFHFVPAFGLHTLQYNILPNILLTVPLGFGIRFVTRLRQRTAFWLPLAAGLGLEGSQLLASLAVRTPYRAFDINDVILNALGVGVGYALFWAWAWLTRAVTRRQETPRGGLLGYLHAVARTGEPPAAGKTTGQKVSARSS